MGHLRPALQPAPATATGASATSPTCVDLVEVAAVAGRFDRRPQPAAHAVPRTPGARQPILAEQPAVPQPALHRRRSGARLRRVAPAQRAAKKAAKELAALRAKSFVDYPAVVAIKQPVFDALYECFRDKHLTGAGGQATRAPMPLRPSSARAVSRCAGSRCSRCCRRTSTARAGRSGRTPTAVCDGPAVAEFASKRREDLEFVQYLQWQADIQLAAAQARARDLGLPIGLYRDLAVGAAADGADAWIASGRDRAVGDGRLPARSVQHAGPGLGHRRRCIRMTLREQGYAAVRHHAARQHAPRRRAAHRPRHGADAPVLDPEGAQAGQRRLRRSIRSRICSPSWRWKASAIAASSSARTWARCPRASASGWPRRTCCPTGCSTSRRTATGSSSRTSTRGWRWPASPPTTWRRSRGSGARPTSTSSGSSTFIPDAAAEDGERSARDDDRQHLLRGAGRAGAAVGVDAERHRQGRR